MLRNRRKGKLSALKRKADILVSKIVRARGKCERCGKSQGVQLQTAHIIGRNNHTLRFDLMNVLCLCAGCHRWGHDDPLGFSLFIEKSFPNRYTYLAHNKNLITKRTVKDYEELIEGLEKHLNDK